MKDRCPICRLPYGRWLARNRHYRSVYQESMPGQEAEGEWEAAARVHLRREPCPAVEAALEFWEGE